MQWQNSGEITLLIMQEFKIPENIPFDSIDKNQYYIYAYLRENDSSIAKAGTPYYIGKGKGKRAFRSDRRCVATPKNIDNIVFIAANIESENEAYRLEKYYTDYFGRVDLGTGILRNLQDGGTGATSRIYSQQTRKKISQSKTGENNPMYGKTGENNPFYGKHHTEETRKKISQSITGEKSHWYGKTGENHPKYGKSLSQETRDKMSKAKKGKKWYNDGEKEYFLKPSNEYDMKYNKGRIKNTQLK